MDDRINLRVGTAETYTPSADCVCANLTADVILPLLPRLLAATCSRLILSGILDHQTITVQSRLNELGVSDCAVMQEGEWVAVVV